MTVHESEIPAGEPEVPEARALGPDSIAWQVFGDLTFPMGAGHRLLIDVAHPVVGSGVRDYSVFETDPYGRAQRTLDMIMKIVYGGEEAAATARGLREMHRSMTGTTPEGKRYSALNPEAFHWVHASLVHGVWVQQEKLGRGWRPGEVEQFYQEMKQVARLYGVREKDMPADWAAFQTWFDEMIATRLSRNDVTDRVLRVIAKPTPPPLPVLGNEFVWMFTLRPIIGWGNSLVTAALLSPKMRELLGVEWNARRERIFRILAAMSRATLPRLPRRIRMVPQAYSRGGGKGSPVLVDEHAA